MAVQFRFMIMIDHLERISLAITLSSMRMLTDVATSGYEQGRTTRVCSGNQ
eukprot:m.1665822 g.1665822  ORF g.1665822 m.1665822 type:complete len:51 (+) comp143067_c0_seq1:82-234(+)